MKTLNKTFDGKSIRITDRNGEPWFIVTDVCKALGIANPTDAIKNHEKDDLDTSEVIDSVGRKQKANIVSEAGLYQLIFKSRKKEAVDFKRWITHEVLPSLRKTGSYSIPDSLKNKSTKTRNLLTDEWKDHGIRDGKEFAYLTLEEYKSLQFEKGKRKKDFTEGEIKTLLALEALEMVNLHYNPVEGYLECKESLHSSAKKVIEVRNKNKELT